jgi:glycosyltransferase involved in cell wall biosynthesis
MKILFIKSNIHHKNLNFILNCKKINFHIINSICDFYNVDINNFDAVISPCDDIDVSKYPNTKFIFGPQFSVFPEDRLSLIKRNKTVYNLLSDWVINIWTQFPACNNLKLVALPFGVDTEKFIDIKSIQDRNKVIVYFKHRNPSDLLFIENFLQRKNINYVIFSYDKKYDEEDYIYHLQNSKFCIWVDAHESQGFALQEALSCNVPLLVWTITSMNQEYGSNYKNWPATTTSYWDNICGEKFHNINELEETFNKLIDNINNYKPREFILENLSVEVCENRFINLINNM